MIVLTGITKRKRQYKNAHKSRSTTREFFLEKIFKKERRGMYLLNELLDMELKKKRILVSEVTQM